VARAGLSIANGRATPVLSALLHAVEARGHALLGDSNSTRTAVIEAQRHYERSRLNGEPSWLGFYTEAELAADFGLASAHMVSGDLEHAAALGRDAVRTAAQ
jgi:hypothetical protein